MFQSLNFNLASSRLLTEAYREFLLKSGADNLRLECVITGHNTLRNSEKTLPNLRADSISLGVSQSFYLCLYFSLSVHYPVSQCTSHFSSSHTCTTLGTRWKTRLLWCHCWIEALFKSWILLLNNFQRKKNRHLHAGLIKDFKLPVHIIESFFISPLVVAIGIWAFVSRGSADYAPFLFPSLPENG